MSKRPKTYDSASSSDIYHEITSVEDVPNQTSKWNEEHRKAMMIEFVNASGLTELIELIVDHPEEWNALSEWDRISFRNAKISDLEHLVTINKKVATIAKKVSKIVGKEETKESVREAEVDSFIMSLLEYVGFDEWPFQTELQHRYLFNVPDPNGRQFSSTVDFLINTKEDQAVMIIEDKHMGNIGFLSEWSEPQIAGEILAFAFNNISGRSYPILVHAVRVVGTRFTFYKAQIEKRYMKEISIAGIPRKKSGVRLEVIRYPPQVNDTTLDAWDFCNPYERGLVLTSLYSLKHLFSEF